MSQKRPGENAPTGDSPPAKLPKVEEEDGVRIEEDGIEQAAEDDAHTDAKYPAVMYKDSGPLSAIQEIYEAPGTDKKMVEVLIPSEYMVCSNSRVKTRQLWGDIVYSGDSDVVAALMHTGFFPHYLPAAPPQVQELRALLHLLPPQDAYPSKARFVKSRAWCAPISACSFKVEACWLVTTSGATVDLSPSMEEAPAPYATVHAQLHRPKATRSSGRAVKEVSLAFNLCNEPWLKYTLPAIADRGLKPSHWTSTRLVKNVLLLETASTRYQVHRTSFPDSTQTPPEDADPSCDVYTLSRCKSVLPAGVLAKVGLPLCAPEHVDVLEERLTWEELHWGIDGLAVRGRMLPLQRMHYAPLTKPRADAA